LFENATKAIQGNTTIYLKYNVSSPGYKQGVIKVSENNNTYEIYYDLIFEDSESPVIQVYYPQEVEVDKKFNVVVIAGDDWGVDKVLINDEEAKNIFSNIYVLNYKLKYIGNQTLNIKAIDISNHTTTKTINIIVLPKKPVETLTYKEYIKTGFSYDFKIFDYDEEIPFTVTPKSFEWNQKNQTNATQPIKVFLIIDKSINEFDCNKSHNYTGKSLSIRVQALADGKLSLIFDLSSPKTRFSPDTIYLDFNFQNYTIYNNKTIEVGNKKGICVLLNESYYE